MSVAVAAYVGWIDFCTLQVVGNCPCSSWALQAGRGCLRRSLAHKLVLALAFGDLSLVRKSGVTCSPVGSRPRTSKTEHCKCSGLGSVKLPRSVAVM